MKKFMSLLLAVLLLVILTSCSKTDNTAEPSEEQPPPTLKEVEEAYQKAMQAFYWFEIGTMPTADFNSADSSTYMEADGMMYAKVKHDTIKDYADLENYLHSLFADDIVTQLLSRGGDVQHYRDFNNALYAIMAERGTDISKGEETLTVTQESNVKFLCSVEVELLGEDGITVSGYETHQYNYEQVNGRWVFTNFYLFR